MFGAISTYAVVLMQINISVKDDQTRMAMQNQSRLLTVPLDQLFLNGSQLWFHSSTQISFSSQIFFFDAFTITEEKDYIIL